MSRGFWNGDKLQLIVDNPPKGKNKRKLLTHGGHFYRGKTENFLPMNLESVFFRAASNDRRAVCLARGYFAL